jgi:hypothetical protein
LHWTALRDNLNSRTFSVEQFKNFGIILRKKFIAIKFLTWGSWKQKGFSSWLTKAKSIHILYSENCLLFYCFRKQAFNEFILKLIQQNKKIHSLSDSLCFEYYFTHESNFVQNLFFNSKSTIEFVRILLKSIPSIIMKRIIRIFFSKIKLNYILKT